MPRTYGRYTTVTSKILDTKDRVHRVLFSNARGTVKQLFTPRTKHQMHNILGNYLPCGNNDLPTQVDYITRLRPRHA